MNPVFSCIIPASAKDLKSQKLQDLIASIKAQDFPQDQIEILVITEGDSEQAKANGIRKAKGEICAMFCADNMIMDKELFKNVHRYMKYGNFDAQYPIQYYYKKDDNSLNRYFSLIGGNDPICYYLGKNDRIPHYVPLRKDMRNGHITIEKNKSYGCNGFFYKSEAIKATNLDHYYPMDNAMEVNGIYAFCSDAIWHRTSDNLISFLIKRYKYARDLYSDRQDRRWKILSTKEDYWRLGGFIVSTVSGIPCLLISIKGFWKIKDWAWFWHWPVCFGFLITYSILVFRNLFKHGRLFQVKCPLPA